MQKRGAVVVVGALALAACSGDDGGGPGAVAAQYAVASTVFGDEGTTTYVVFLDALDAGDVDLSSAREFAGWATIGGVERMLFVGDGEAPTLTRYSADEQGTFAESGRLSFLDFGAAGALYRNVFGDSSRAFMAVDDVQRVAWDPTTLEAIGVVELEGVDTARDGLAVRASFDRGAVAREGRVLHPHYFADDDYYRFAPASQIAVIDTATGEAREVLEAPCPGLDVASVDEAGNAYFSNWVFSAPAPHFDESAPRPCVVRVPADRDAVDTTWTRDLSTLVGDRPTAAFRYLADGVALVAVLHTEELPADVVPGQAALATAWRLWRVDTTSWTAAPIDELGLFSGGYYAFRVGGDRTIVLLPTNDYGSTSAYEIGAEGAPTLRFTIPGWAYQLVELGE
ncbi:MxcI [Sandaracinus amylolyticus]|uniref:MxcI n=1 Tax=Sandaracinus amylolyticus TaxID=927083 RepID=UPI001F244DAA|nr:MxcI [Sandaracinus amylolyticus]UJR86660.1 Hypothetical protein I5071_87610 [Sandaracinus amylolyticus]